MVSLATLKTGSFAGIVITASHNPPSYNGFKIKAHYGGPASPIEIDKVEKLIPDALDYNTLSFESYLENGLIEWIDAETMYFEHVQNNFDMKAIEDSKLNFAYDAMYGAGQSTPCED